MKQVLRVAACSYPVESPADISTFLAKQTSWVEAAVERGAELLVFPEYASLELSSALPTSERGDLHRELAALQRWLPELIDSYAHLAAKHRVHILAPSFPEQEPTSGTFRNRARLHTPNGRMGIAEKTQMTRFESEVWGICPGDRQEVFVTELGVLGVAICYDSEFPLLVRRQIELGAQLILVPSCTDTLAGYHRVSLSCRARALENQCYVVQATTVGHVPNSLTLDQNHGAAAVFGPVDIGFPEDGVIARGALDIPGWVMADLNFAELRRVREDGQVRNHRDWNTHGHLFGIAHSAKLA